MDNQKFKSKNGREYILKPTNEYDTYAIMELLDAEGDEDFSIYKLVDYVFGNWDINKPDDLKVIMCYVNVYEKNKL